MFANMSPSWILLVFVVSQIRQSWACAGYKVNVTNITPCGGEKIVTLSDDFGVVMDKSCNVYLKGCFEINKRLETVKVKYTINKVPLPTLEGTVDVCDIAIKMADIAREPLEKLGLPMKCPIEKMKYCGSEEKSFNMAKFKGQLGMAKGHTDVKLEADLGDAGMTCMEIGVDVMKPRKKKTSKIIKEPADQ